MFCPCHTRDKGFSLLHRLWWTFSLWHTSPILVSCKTPPCALSLYLSIKLGQRDIFLMYIFPASISPCYFPIRPLVGFLLRVQLSLPASVWMVKDKYTLTVNRDNHMRWWDETVVYCPDFSLPPSLPLSLSLCMLLLHGGDIALISQHSVICVTTASSSFYVKRVRAQKRHPQWRRAGISTGHFHQSQVKFTISLLQHSVMYIFIYDGPI